MNMVFDIIGLACLTYLLTVAEPVIQIKEWMGLNNPNGQGIKGWMSRLLSCCLCLGFWVGLMGTWSLTMAAIVSISAEVINNWMCENNLIE